MIRLESVEDDLNRMVTYALSDGRRICVDRRMVEEFGLAEVARIMGVGDQIPTGRLDVLQRGAKVGTVPATFEPMAIHSTSFFYEPRSGDFRREGDKWVASDTLGPGDLEAVPGFAWDYESRYAPARKRGVC